MLQSRPRTAALYLERPRLLRLLPEEPGYVVWLEAPYGYGKSVLLGQWAQRQEAAGRTLLWLALAGADARTGLSVALRLPAAAPWTVLLPELARRRAALVLEDLEGGEALGPLLRQLPGPLALASRGPLPEAELPRLRAQGRLTHLDAQALAFTRQEAAQLFDQTPGAEAVWVELAWERSAGWPLPLHLAALTGSSVLDTALWAGLRESLPLPEWRELLLLSGLPQLPGQAADERAERLTRLGLVQALAGGYRLHPLARQALATARPFAAQRLEVLRQELPRLPGALRAQGYAGSSLWPELAAALEDDSLAVDDAAGVRRWEALCREHSSQSPGPGRLLGGGWAFSAGGALAEATRLYLAAARHPQASAQQRLEGLAGALSELPGSESVQAQALLDEAAPWLTQVSSAVQATFWGNAAARPLYAERWAEAERLLKRALALAPPQRRDTPLSNLAMVRWELYGDLEGYRDHMNASLALPGLSPYNLAVKLEALGQLNGLLDPARALAQLDRLAGLMAHNPYDTLMGRAQAAALRADTAAFAELEREVRDWNEGGGRGERALGRVAALHGRTLRQAGQLAEARWRLEAAITLGDPLVAAELALTLGSLGQQQAGLERLEAVLGTPQRFVRLHAWAARYRLTRSESDLARLLALTLMGARVLPALVPLAELPVQRPELACAYPLGEVLASGWRAAIRTRLPELPPLRVLLLGRVEVRVLGQAAALPSRPRDLLVLLALGRSRQAAAEALWPELDLSRSRNNLHVNLNTLRRWLEPWGESSYLQDSGLTHTDCDLWTLEDALRRTDAAATRQLYAELAPGLDLPGLEVERRTLRDRALAVVLGGLHQDASGEEQMLEWVLTHDPLHEAALERLLALLVRSGRRTSAARRYALYAGRLREELGLDPSGTLRRDFGGARR